MNSYTAALLRQWWVVAVGIVVAIGVATYMAYDVPGFTPREKPVYMANAQLLVTSPEGSYIRVSVTRPTEVSPGGSSDGGNDSEGSILVREPPDVRPLLQAADLYPLLIESDQVRALRTKMFGPIDGRVVASVIPVVNRPRSQLPAIDIFASSSTEEKAVALANATWKAFRRWVQLEQQRTKLEQRERILIQPIRVPTNAVASGGPSFAIPVLAALAVLAGFGMLALVLDRVFVPAAVRTPETR